jgi:hypothetical protein
VRRVDGRVVIGVILAVGLVFVVLNLLLAGGPSGVRVLSSPSSGHARPGVAYTAHLLSACAPAVDFDGSYWKPLGGWTLSPPIEPATVRLVSPDRAELRLRSGERIRLSRAGDTIRLSSCHPGSGG